MENADFQPTNHQMQLIKDSSQ